MENTNVYKVTLSGDVAEKLYTAFFGLPDQRREKVEEQIDGLTKTMKIDRIEAIKIATFHEIFEPKLDHYYEKGQVQREKIKTDTVNMLASLSQEERNNLLASLGVVQK